MYGKLFEEIFYSTVADHGGDTIYVFMSMIILSDADGYIRHTPSSLARMIGKDVSIVKEAIGHLEAPDKDSNDPKFDGRRIIPMSELTDGEENRGWWVVNKTKYAAIAKRKERAEQSTARSQRYRANHKGNKINDETQGDLLGRKSEHVDVDVDVDTNEDLIKNIGVDLQIWKAFKKHRQRVKAPMTERAETLIIQKLIKFKAEGMKPNDVLDQSIEKGWKGVFPLEKEKTGLPSTQLGPTGKGRLARAGEAMRQHHERKQSIPDGK